MSFPVQDNTIIQDSSEEFWSHTKHETIMSFPTEV